MPVSPTQPVNLTLPVEAMQPCGLPPMARDGKWDTLHRNHVDVAAWGHLCSDRHDGLIDSLKHQQGITINGTSTKRANASSEHQ